VLVAVVTGRGAMTSLRYLRLERLIDELR
jgi:hypothetical protein